MTWQVIGWILTGLCFLLGIIGTIIPVLPGSFLVLLGTIFYGWLVAPLPWYFYLIQGILVVLSLLIDYLMGIWGVKRFGGSRYAVWGSIIGLILGVIIFNLPGILLGPFLGAAIGDFISNQDYKAALKCGWGAVVGNLGSVLVKLGFIVTMLLIFLVFIVS